MSEDVKLVFVYNADSGFGIVKDFFHKILRPETYPCNLCGLTYGNFSIKKEWKEFIENLEVPVEFLHRNQFMKRFVLKDVEFPSAFIERDSNISLLISDEEINRLQSLTELKELVIRKLDMI